jgi:D-galactose 1-dehydrogenase
LSAAPIRIAIVGIGKIARDQHLPAILGAAGFVLAAVVDPQDPHIDGIAHFPSLEALLETGPQVDAVALCTPPQMRRDLAAQAIARGLHVFLEKPPCASLSEVAMLEHMAASAGTCLFAAWHSRFAGKVAAARDWLNARKIRRVSIRWREDVCVWHPGQAWIWEPGGLGVFDPGINALSIATFILPEPIFLIDAVLAFPENRAAPIAAQLQLRAAGGAPISMDLDWRQTGPQSWDIEVETDMGMLRLARGGAELTLDGKVEQAEDREYSGLYQHFSTLVRAGRSEVDIAPLRLVADAFLRARRETVEAFHD